jgi:poly-gamma-glutamate capsule biosynthesis protein CapA/YwtB (metallophosphatase superfamily)
MNKPIDSRGGETQVLLVIGDTNIQNRADPGSAFAHARDTLASADMIFAHLEGPLAEPSKDPAYPDIPHKRGWRHSGRAVGPALKAAGYDAVSCASNVWFPATAALASVQVLDEVGIAHCGAGATLAEARRPAIIERGGLRIGVLSYTSVFWPSNHAAGPDTPGCATIRAYEAFQPSLRSVEMPGGDPIVRTFADPQELEAMRRDVRALRDQVDLVMLSCHWGVSARTEPVEYQKEIARAAIDAGADMVFGHHPHEVQGAETYRGRPIFYSLGNFAFDWDVMRNRHLDGILLRCTIHNRALARIEVLPVRRDAQNDIRVHAADSTEGADVLGRFARLSGKLAEGVVLSPAAVLELAPVAASAG